MEHAKWLTDEQLNRCSLETQGFWMRCICMMHKAGTAKLEGTAAELCRLLSVTAVEFRKGFTELNRTKTANVTQTANFFTLVSRRYAKELKIREQNRLRKQRERRHAAVAEKSQDRVKSKSKSKKEEKSEATASVTPAKPEGSKKPKAPADPRRLHPAIVAVRSVMSRYPDKDLWDKTIKRLGDKPDESKLRECWEEWIERGYNKMSLKWLNWYFDGIPYHPDEIQAKAKNGHKQKTQEELEAIAKRAGVSITRG